MHSVLSTDRFIETEAVKLSGGDAEQAVWQALKGAFAHLSGVGQHPLYNELEQVIASGASFSFTYRQPKRAIEEA